MSVNPIYPNNDTEYGEDNSLGESVHSTQTILPPRVDNPEETERLELQNEIEEFLSANEADMRQLSIYETKNLTVSGRRYSNWRFNMREVNKLRPESLPFDGVRIVPRLAYKFTEIDDVTLELGDFKGVEDYDTDWGLHRADPASSVKVSDYKSLVVEGFGRVEFLNPFDDAHISKIPLEELRNFTGKVKEIGKRIGPKLEPIQNGESRKASIERLLSEKDVPETLMGQIIDWKAEIGNQHCGYKTVESWDDDGNLTKDREYFSQEALGLPKDIDLEYMYPSIPCARLLIENSEGEILRTRESVGIDMVINRGRIYFDTSVSYGNVMYLLERSGWDPRTTRIYWSEIPLTESYLERFKDHDFSDVENVIPATSFPEGYFDPESEEGKRRYELLVNLVGPKKASKIANEGDTIWGPSGWRNVKERRSVISSSGYIINEGTEIPALSLVADTGWGNPSFRTNINLKVSRSHKEKPLQDGKVKAYYVLNNSMDWRDSNGDRPHTNNMISSVHIVFDDENTPIKVG